MITHMSRVHFLFIFILCIIPPLSAQEYPPPSFTMGTYKSTTLKNIYDKDYCQWRWVWSYDTITLYANRSFTYRSYAYSNAFQRIVYSYGEWAYKNETFILHSVKKEMDTLKLQQQWDAEHYKYGLTTKYCPTFTFLEISEENLYIVQNIRLSFQRLLFFPLGQPLEFDDFIWRFIHDINYQDSQIKGILRTENIPIGALNHESVGQLSLENEKREKSTYKSLSKSPYAIDKLPQNYAVSINVLNTSEWNTSKAQCSFFVDDILIYTMYFDRPSRRLEWYLIYIELGEYWENKNVINDY